jgi:hypothetical protein
MRFRKVAYEAFPQKPGAYRVVLEVRAEGVYINVFENATALEPYIDWLAPHLEGAKLAGLEEFGIGTEEWREVPDEPWHAPP